MLVKKCIKIQDCFVVHKFIKDFKIDAVLQEQINLLFLNEHKFRYGNSVFAVVAGQTTCFPQDCYNFNMTSMTVIVIATEKGWSSMYPL